jgi:hypothetical protein
VGGGIAPGPPVFLRLSGRTARVTGGGRPPVGRRVSASVRARLDGELRDAGFDHLPAQAREIPAPDARVYAIETGGHALRRDETQVEPALQPAVATLLALASRR